MGLVVQFLPVILSTKMELLSYLVRMLHTYLGTGRTYAPSEVKPRLIRVENDRLNIIYFTISPYLDVFLKLINTMEQKAPKKQRSNI